MNKTVGFIGCGNMGSALIRAAVKTIEPQQVLISDVDSVKRDLLAGETGARPCETAELVKLADAIYLGVKPQHFDHLLDDIHDTLAARPEKPLLVSMAAGITIDHIVEKLGDYPIVRIMPNLAAAVGEGVILYTERNTNAGELELFLTSMREAGELCPLDENQIDAGMALTGCGPAFVYLFIEALADGAVSLGIPRAKAYRLASQTLLGSAKLQMETGKTPAELKDAVCSPAGTTIAGVLALERYGFRHAAAQAVLESYWKTKEL